MLTDRLDRRKWRVNEEHRRVIEAAGGVYIRGMIEDLVLFNSPVHNQTLALPEYDLTEDNVRTKILVSNARYHVITITEESRPV